MVHICPKIGHSCVCISTNRKDSVSNVGMTVCTLRSLEFTPTMIDTHDYICKSCKSKRINMH